MRDYLRILDNIYNGKSALLSSRSFYTLPEEYRKQIASLLRDLHNGVDIATKLTSKYNIVQLYRALKSVDGGIKCDECNFTFPKEFMHDAVTLDRKTNKFLHLKLCDICKNIMQLEECPKCGKYADAEAMFILHPRFYIGKNDKADNLFGISEKYIEGHGYGYIPYYSEYFEEPVVKDIFNEIIGPKLLNVVKKNLGSRMCVDCMLKLGFDVNMFNDVNRRNYSIYDPKRQIYFVHVKGHYNSSAREFNYIKYANAILKEIDTYSDSIPRANSKNTKYIPIPKCNKMIMSALNKGAYYLSKDIAENFTPYFDSRVLNYKNIDRDILSMNDITFEVSKSPNNDIADVLIIVPIDEMTYLTEDFINNLIKKEIPLGWMKNPFNNSEIWCRVNSRGEEVNYKVFTEIKDFSIEDNDGFRTVMFTYTVSHEDLV